MSTLLTTILGLLAIFAVATSIFAWFGFRRAAEDKQERRERHQQKVRKLEQQHHFD